MAQIEIETCIDWCEPGWAFFSSNERSWICKIRKLNKQHPNEAVIMKEPEDNHGVIYAKFPQKWTRIAPPRVVHLSDEKRRNLAEKLRLYRESQTLEKEG